MRQAIRDIGWLRASADFTTGEVMGINLGFDFCAEHEWGFKKMAAILGSDQDGITIEDRAITNFEHVRLFDSGKTAPVVLLAHKAYWEPEALFETIKKLTVKNFAAKNPWRMYGTVNLATAWDSNSFVVVAWSDEDKENVRRLHSEMIAGNTSLWQANGFMGRGGLVISITSMVPQTLKDTFKEANEDRIRLKEAADATGIVARIDELNNKSDGWSRPCGYYALSPAWAGDGFKTAHKVKFWLNPQDQKNNQFGWYSVEDLELWLLGKGPVKQMRRPG